MSDSDLARKAQWLIIGRLMVIFVLVIASWIWNAGALRLSFDDFPRGLFYVFLASVGLTIIYFLLLRLARNLEWQIRLQFFIDIGLITLLVWRTGDINSPYITLYTVLICVASLFLTSSETLLVSALSALLFTILSMGIVWDFFPAVPGRPAAASLSKSIQIIGFHDIAFLVVGLLAARIADRYSFSRARLREAAQTLADLRVLHERIIHSIRSGLVTTDLEGKIYIFNAAAEEITGFKAADVRGKSVFSIFGNISPQIRAALGALEKGESMPRFELNFFTPEGLGLRLGYAVSPLFAPDGEKTGLIITFQDLTEIRSMEESARRRDRLAAVGRVAAGLAHEIRNPLGAMRGAIQVLRPQMEADESRKSLMDIIIGESDRLNRIITNFLSYARPQTGNFTKIDLKEAINDTVTLLKHGPEITAKHIFEVNVPDSLVEISGDVTQLKQMFWNLSRNALQAMPEGGSLKVSLQQLPNARVRLVFADDGCGMPPEQVEQLFEPFSKSTTGGTGLGLSIVYQIVRDHGGTINVRSRQGGGTTITIELPEEYKLAVFSGSDPAAGELPASNLQSFLSTGDRN